MDRHNCPAIRKSCSAPADQWNGWSVYCVQSDHPQTPPLHHPRGQSEFTPAAAWYWLVAELPVSFSHIGILRSPVGHVRLWACIGASSYNIAGFSRGVVSWRWPPPRTPPVRSGQKQSVRARCGRPLVGERRCGIQDTGEASHFSVTGLGEIVLRIHQPPLPFPWYSPLTSPAVGAAILTRVVRTSKFKPKKLPTFQQSPPPPP